MLEWIKLFKVKIALIIAALIHIIALIGILSGYKEMFIEFAWLNVIVLSLLMIWTQALKTLYFYIYVAVCVVVGFIIEIIAVHSGLLFGEISFGNALGLKVIGVPLLIGFQWFVITYAASNVVFHFYGGVLKKYDEHKILLEDSSKRIVVYGLMIDAALLTCFFDWIIESVAQKLDYWHWLHDGYASIFNYLSWFLVSCIMHIFFFSSKFDISKPNTFAINLFFIQVLFFLALRFFLK